MFGDVLFSIVVPVFNVENYLEETMDSILSQVDEKSTEVILVNDGSTDKSGVLCDIYAKRYPQVVKVFHKENEGLLLTRRFGFSKARGRYIINCDSDDTFEIDAFDKITKAVIENEPDVLIFNINIWNKKGKFPFYRNVFTEEESCLVNKEVLYENYFRSAATVSMCGKVFRRSCIDVSKDYSKYYRKSLGEDTIQSAEVYTNADKIFYLNEALYNYRSGSGMTANFNPEYFHDFSQIYKDIETYLEYWNGANMKVLFAEKLFVCVGRAITQSRYLNRRDFRFFYNYYEDIRNDELVQKYIELYTQVKGLIKYSYRILVGLLLKKGYRRIILLLKLKNLVSIAKKGRS